ncbi:MAG: zf-HC2 domain-containing protein [Gemmatimonadales bacterium]
MSHLDEGTLHALLDGELEIAEVREIQLHLGMCAACGSRLQDVKQFLAEADRLVGTLEIPPGAGRARSEPPPPPPATPPPPSPKPRREPESWEAPPLLLPDPLEGSQRRKRWARGLRWAAMIAVVVFGGRAVNNTLRPSKPELQFNDRDAAPAIAATPPAVASPQETVRPAGPTARRAQPTPVDRPPTERAAPAPEPKALADRETSDTNTDELGTVAARGDSAPTEDVTVRGAETTQPGTVDSPREEVDLETRRAASAALAELDRERLRSRAAAATAALPPAQPETPAATEPPPPPPTLEQRGQVYLRIGLDEAARQLGRPLHVIEAMTPQFIGLTQGRGVPGADASRPVVRVVYQDSRGRMILLDQQRMLTGQSPGAAAGSLRWALGDVMLYLHGEPGPDVLRNLQRRVR